MKKITYVTGNWAKVKSAKQILEPLGYTIDNVKMDTIEIQAENVDEVAAYSAKYASQKLKTAVLKNDTGLFIEALNGFPGPYTHYVEDKIGEEKVLKLLENEKNRKAYFIESFAYCEYKKEPVIFRSVTKGHIAKEKSGTYGWGWDFIFIPDGSDKTLANYPDNERFALWDDTAYKELVEYLEKKDNK